MDWHPVISVQQQTPDNDFCHFSISNVRFAFWAFFSKTGKKLGSHTGSKWWPGDPVTRTWKMTQITHWLNDRVPCLLHTLEHSLEGMGLHVGICAGMTLAVPIPPIPMESFPFPRIPSQRFRCHSRSHSRFALEFPFPLPPCTPVPIVSNDYIIALLETWGDFALLVGMGLRMGIVTSEWEFICVWFICVPENSLMHER